MASLDLKADHDSDGGSTVLRSRLTPAAGSTVVDSTVVDTTVVDSTVVDSNIGPKLTSVAGSTIVDSRAASTIGSTVDFDMDSVLSS